MPARAGGHPPAFYDELWRAACVKAGCPGKIPRDFRRTAARNLVRAGVTEKIAMTLMGYKTRSIFDRYSILNEKDLQEAVAKLAALPVTKPAKSR